MIPKINNILYATDLSKNSAYAFRYAVNSALKHDAKIHIFHVQDTTPASVEAMLKTHSPTESWEGYAENEKKEMKKYIKEKLEAFCRREFNKYNPTLMERVASIEVIDGDPAGKILQKGDEIRADLVVMGTHSKGPLAHAFLGSVAEKVLNRIKIPVFIIPIPMETDISSEEILA
jgi:nucleotide-binding universal stress UspA family protein